MLYTKSVSRPRKGLLIFCFVVPKWCPTLQNHAVTGYANLFAGFEKMPISCGFEGCSYDTTCRLMTSKMAILAIKKAPLPTERGPRRRENLPDAKHHKHIECNRQQQNSCCGQKNLRFFHKRSAPIDFLRTVRTEIFGSNHSARTTTLFCTKSCRLSTVLENFVEMMQEKGIFSGTIIEWGP